jgi:hypothetical protein
MANRVSPPVSTGGLFLSQKIKDNLKEKCKIHPLRVALIHLVY